MGWNSSALEAEKSLTNGLCGFVEALGPAEPLPAPLRRIGTFGLAVVAACAFSLGIAGQVLTFRTFTTIAFDDSSLRWLEINT